MSDDTPYADAPPNLVDLIDKLLLPSEPAPISMMPQTAGWSVLALLLVMAAAFGLFRYFEHRKINAYRRAALAELEHVRDDPVAISAIVRRTALQAYPRKVVASLSGTEWLAFLDRTAKTQEFTTGAGQTLAIAPYKGGKSIDPALAKTVEHWIRHHSREAIT